MCLWAFVVYAKLSQNWMFYNNDHWLSSRFCMLAVWDLFSRVFRRASPALIPSLVTTGHQVALVLEVTGCQTCVCGVHVYATSFLSSMSYFSPSFPLLPPLTFVCFRGIFSFLGVSFSVQKERNKIWVPVPSFHMIKAEVKMNLSLLPFLWSFLL